MLQVIKLLKRRERKNLGKRCRLISRTNGGEETGEKKNESEKKMDGWMKWRGR